MNKVEEYLILLKKFNETTNDEEIEDYLYKLDKLWYSLSSEETRQVEFAIKTIINNGVV